MFRPGRSVLNGLDGYTRYFQPDTGQDPVAVLESTPSYLYSATALRVLPDLPSQPRVVFVLREPSAQVYSLFRYFQSSWNWIPPEMTFREFVDRAYAGNPLAYRGNELAQNAIRNARFVDFLLEWRDALGVDRMRIYLFEELLADSRTLVQRVGAFAGLDPRFFDDFDFQSFNRTFAVRSRGVHNLIIAARAMVPKGRMYNASRGLYRRFNTVAPTAKNESDIETLAALRGFFQNDNQRLANEFALDLSSWA
jgi:hypothetical protein